MRKLFFILLICNMLFVNAQSLELENWKIINSSELNAELLRFRNCLIPLPDGIRPLCPLPC